MPERVLGWDQSGYQTWVNLDRALGLGYKFVIHRLGGYGTFKDSRVEAVWALARRSYIKFGVYYLLDLRTTIRQQIDHILRLLDNRTPDLPVALDCEWGGQWRGREANSEHIWGVARGLEERLGRRPLIYTAAGWWNANTIAQIDWARFPLWVAHWGAASPTLPRGWREWKIWQFAGDVRGTGIAEAIDKNYFNGSYEELLEWIGQAQPPAPPPPQPAPQPPPPVVIPRQLDEGGFLDNLGHDLNRLSATFGSIASAVEGVYLLGRYLAAPFRTVQRDLRWAAENVWNFRATLRLAYSTINDLVRGNLLRTILSSLIPDADTLLQDPARWVSNRVVALWPGWREFISGPRDWVAAQIRALWPRAPDVLGNFDRLVGQAIERALGEARELVRDPVAWLKNTLSAILNLEPDFWRDPRAHLQELALDGLWDFLERNADRVASVAERILMKVWD
jgi:GH25 family lysozyme M1 (1,4-beta-N-acetylmuramidase)